MKVADLPTLLELGPGVDRGSVQARDSALVNGKLRKGQDWRVSRGRDSSYEYFVTMGGRGLVLAYLLTTRDNTDTLNGAVAAPTSIW